MTAVTKPVTFSWIPKGGGKGGQFSNATSHDADTDMLSLLQQYYVSGGRWIGRQADKKFGDYTGGTFPLSVYPFNSFSSINQQYFSFLMTSAYKSSPLVGFQRGYFNAAGVLTLLDTNGVGTHQGNFFNPTVFQSVKNKCYASDGMTFTQNAGGLVGPRIYYDTVGDGAALSGINWGLPTPIPNLQAIPDPNSYQQGTGNTHGTTVVDGLSFDPTVHLAAGMPFYIETAAGSGQSYEYIIQSVTATSVTLTTSTIGLAATGLKVQGNYGSMSWGSSQPNIIVGTGTTHGSTTIDGLSFDPTVQVRIGYRVLIETVLNSGVWNTYTVTGTPSSTSITVSIPTVENYTPARVRVDLPATSSGISSDSSYVYAIAYMDTKRGHVGDPGPRLTVNWGPPFNKRINIKILNITDAPPQGGTGKRWTNWTYDKVLLWRTGSDGAVLKSRVLLAPAGGPGIQSFVDNQSDDTQLGLVGPIDVGISTRVTSHSPPPDDLNFATYWEGRFFGLSPSNPGILYWTAAAGQEIDNYGVPEECWPPLNTLPIPETDGLGTGLKVVGSSLIVETQRNLFQVTYNTTNTSALFRLQRLSAKGSGTTHFASATMPGEDSQSGDILIHFGNDKRLYLLYGAGGDIPISYPIQDQLNQITNPALVRVGVWHTQDATYIILMPNQFFGIGWPKTMLMSAYLYDVDRKIWFTVVEPQSCFAEGIFSGTIQAFTGGLDVASIYTVANDSTLVPAPAGNFWFETQFFTPPGVPRLDTKDFQYVVIYADNVDPALDFVVLALVDDGQAPGASFTRLNTTTNPFLKTYMDAANARVYVPSAINPISGRTFKLRAVLTPSNLNAPAPIVYEIMGIFSVTVDEASTGGVV